MRADQYFEETVLRIPAEQVITPKRIEYALAKKKPATQRKKRKKK